MASEKSSRDETGSSKPDHTGPGAAAAGMSFGMRMASELVSAVMVGAGLGYLLDSWLETQPWMTVVFLFLGVAAGFRNMYRAVNPDNSERFKAGQ
ncbi:MAG: AtpZ/AtpI family protein [Magnetococcales bacterium]|nr:AtpZ/AtpI family protein [Magnetococcales bacterium]